jgi:hypothetical protein
MLDPDWIQWPAMLVTIVSSWLTASGAKQRREWGFRLFLISNLLWVAWGWHDGAWALVALQFVLAAMNLRGMRRNDPAARQPAD